MIRTLTFSLKATWGVAMTRAKKRFMDRIPVHCHSTLSNTCSPLSHSRHSVVGVDKETGRPPISVRWKTKLEMADRRGNSRNCPQNMKISIGEEKIKRRVKKSAVSRKCSLVWSLNFNDPTVPTVF